MITINYDNRDNRDYIVIAKGDVESPDNVQYFVDMNNADGNTSDGAHSFNELYYHRTVLFSVIVREYHFLAWKSKKHNDGTMYDRYFIVGIDTPRGQATYHCEMKYWDLFDCKEKKKAPKWDGHTPEQAIERIGQLDRQEAIEYYLKRTGNLSDALHYMIDDNSMVIESHE